MYKGNAKINRENQNRSNYAQARNRGCLKCPVVTLSKDEKDFIRCYAKGDKVINFVPDFVCAIVKLTFEKVKD